MIFFVRYLPLFLYFFVRHNLVTGFKPLHGESRVTVADHPVLIATHHPVLAAKLRKSVGGIEFGCSPYLNSNILKGFATPFLSFLTGATHARARAEPVPCLLSLSYFSNI